MSERVKTDPSVRLIVKIMVAVDSSDDVSVTTRYLASLSPATLGPACIGEMGSMVDPSGAFLIRRAKRSILQRNFQ